MPICKSCNTDVSQDSFYVHTRDSEGKPLRYMNKCKACYGNQSLDHYRSKRDHYNKLQCKYRAENKDKFKQWRLKRNWDLTVDEFESMISKQDNRCFLCNIEFCDKRGMRPNVDHCHDTGRIRKLLCTRCNTAMGLLKENVSVLNKMINYIQGEN